MLGHLFAEHSQFGFRQWLREPEGSKCPFDHILRFRLSHDELSLASGPKSGDLVGLNERRKFIAHAGNLAHQSGGDRAGSLQPSARAWDLTACQFLHPAVCLVVD